MQTFTLFVIRVQTHSLSLSYLVSFRSVMHYSPLIQEKRVISVHDVSHAFADFCPNIRLLRR